ncbi:MAG: AI-2E family transporter [Candidatus Paceibacterota bacterium]
MQTKIIEKYFFFGLLFAVFVFTFFIFRPFWIVLVLGASFSIVLYPIYKWLIKLKFPNSLSAFTTISLFVIILCGPLLGIGNIIFNQSQNVYHVVVNNENTEPILNSINNTVNKILPDSITFDVKSKLTDFVSYVYNNIANIFSTTVSAFFSFILILLIIFYFLKDGIQWKNSLIALSPLPDKDDEKIINQLILSVKAVMGGYLFIALIQGVLMGFGLWLFNIPNPALWGLVAAVTSLLPTIGTAFISIPAIIFLFATGNTVSAVGLLIWSVVVVGLVDNFLTPIIIGKKINISPLLILFSVLGGISFLGPVGILIGPLSVSLLYTLISIYRNEFSQNAQNATI